MRIEIENVGFDDNDDDIDVGVDVGNVEKLPKKPPFVGVRSTKEVARMNSKGRTKKTEKMVSLVEVVTRTINSQWQ